MLFSLPFKTMPQPYLYTMFWQKKEARIQFQWLEPFQERWGSFFSECMLSLYLQNLPLCTRRPHNNITRTTIASMFVVIWALSPEALVFAPETSSLKVCFLLSVPLVILVLQVSTMCVSLPFRFTISPPLLRCEHPLLIQWLIRLPGQTWSSSEWCVFLFSLSASLLYLSFWSDCLVVTFIHYSIAAFSIDNVALWAWTAGYGG